MAMKMLTTAHGLTGDSRLITWIEKNGHSLRACSQGPYSQPSTGAQVDVNQASLQLHDQGDPRSLFQVSHMPRIRYISKHGMTEAVGLNAQRRLMKEERIVRIRGLFGRVWNNESPANN